MGCTTVLDVIFSVLDAPYNMNGRRDWIPPDPTLFVFLGKRSIIVDVTSRGGHRIAALQSTSTPAARANRGRFVATVAGRAVLPSSTLARRANFAILLAFLPCDVRIAGRSSTLAFRQ